VIWAETARTVLRTWEDRDRPAFHRLNSDPAVMRFFPFRRDREASDRMMDDLNQRFAQDGLTFFALEEKADGRTIGMVGPAIVEAPLPFAPAVEIGWRLLPEFWGEGFVTQAAAACLDRLFAPPHAASEVVSFCVTSNARSEAVMRRLGFSHAGEFDHPRVDPATHPERVRHHLYRLERMRWTGLER